MFPAGSCVSHLRRAAYIQAHLLSRQLNSRQRDSSARVLAGPLRAVVMHLELE